MEKKRLLTRQEVRQDLIYRGISMKECAKRNNLNYEAVRAVLSKDLRCAFGEVHKAAVKLGMKDGVIELEQP